MSLEVGGIGNASAVTAQNVVQEQIKSDEKVKENPKAEESAKEEAAKKESGVVYEKGMNTGDNLYSINRMNKQDRTAIVNQLKADAEQREQQLLNIVRQTLTGQVGAYGTATGDSIWKTLASGNFTVDAATKAQAQEDISEDGYYGVKQTSQRLFDFASALAGDDVDKMKEMQAAMEKGFKLATKEWGRDLPDISKDTLAAANKLFEDYYASKNGTTAETVE
ncbi:hypothetical protein [Butyrivibrio sp. AE3006]|uniref:hypothetical protein n=1 Tax=Butyrivibrio sp. AE3006 TaxID=1280673 RepID=UPI000417B160|nr:hypothetical protein [Butyrivibrio sp. AE3006]